MFKGLLKSMGITCSEKENKQSKDIAKDRLKLVLMHERIQLTPDKLAQMREEIIEVINKYLEIDNKDTEISVQSDNSATAFVLNAKIVKVR